MNVLVDKGNDKINFYSDKSAEINSHYTIIKSNLRKPSNPNPKDSKNNHQGAPNLDNSKPSKTRKVISFKSLRLNCLDISQVI